MPSESGDTFIERVQRSVNIVHSPALAWVILILSLILTFFAYWFASRQMEERASDRFAFRSNEIVHAVTERLQMYEQALQGGVGLFNASDEVSRAEWKAYVDALKLSDRLPGIQGIGYAVPVASSERDQFEQSIREEGFAGFSIQPEGAREELTSILYLEPFDWRNQRAFGYDMWSDDSRREAMKNARDYNIPTISGVVTLVQETEEDTQRGFLLYLPVFKTGQPLGSVAERRQNFMGWVYAPFRAADLMEGILGTGESDIAFEIFDGRESNGQMMIYDSNNQMNRNSNPEELFFSMTYPLHLYNRDWTIFFSATYQAFYQESGSRQPVLILLAGILIDTLLFYVIVSLHLVNRHTRRKEKELRNTFLQNEKHLELQAAQIEAAKRESELFFEWAPEAFFVVDAQGQIKKANQAAHELFQFDSGQLLGVQFSKLVAIENFSGVEGTASRTTEASKRSGAKFSILVNWENIEFHGEPLTVFAVIDNSQQLQVEQTLAEAQYQAMVITQRVSAFVANMSDTLRRPLQAGLDSTEFLALTLNSRQQHEYIDSVRNSARLLRENIDCIEDITSIEAGLFKLNSSNMDLNDVIERIAVDMTRIAKGKKLELVIDLDPEVRTDIAGDSIRLQQVLVSLLQYLVEQVDSGSVTLNISLLDLINIRDQLWRISIRCSHHDVDKNFVESAQRNCAATIPLVDIDAQDLSLATSSRLLSLMGSKLHFLTEPGLEFRFDLLVECLVDGIVESAEQKGRVLDDAREKPKRVLIVESNSESRQALENVFSSLTWPCQSVKAIGDEAQISAMSRPVDWLILSKDAYLAAVKNHWFEPMIANLSQARIFLIVQADEALNTNLYPHIDAILVKPVVMAHILQQVNSVVGRRDSTIEHDGGIPDVPGVLGYTKVNNIVKDRDLVRDPLTPQKRDKLTAAIAQLIDKLAEGKRILNSGIAALKERDYQRALADFQRLRLSLAKFEANRLSTYIGILEGHLREMRGYSDLTEDVAFVEREYEDFFQASRRWIWLQKQRLSHKVE